MHYHCKAKTNICQRQAIRESKESARKLAKVYRVSHVTVHYPNTKTAFQRCFCLFKVITTFCDSLNYKEFRAMHPRGCTESFRTRCVSCTKDTATKLFGLVITIDVLRHNVGVRPSDKYLCFRYRSQRLHLSITKHIYGFVNFSLERR